MTAPAGMVMSVGWNESLVEPNGRPGRLCSDDLFDDDADDFVSPLLLLPCASDFTLLAASMRTGPTVALGGLAPPDADDLLLARGLLPLADFF